MQVVGVTTPQEVYAVSKERKFRINEILVMEDITLNEPKGEVIETLSYNHLIPMGMDKTVVDSDILQTLAQIGYDIETDEINIAKVRLFTEAPHPLKTGCSVRLPSFDEVRGLLVKADIDCAMTLGEIRGTGSLNETLSDDLRDKVTILEEDEMRPQQGVPFLFDIFSMHQYPHIGVFGGSGSGKSFGLRVMLEELMHLEIPTVVFDPHFEMDFSCTLSGQASYEERFLIAKVGQQVGISFTDLNTRDIIELLGTAGGFLSESMVNVVQMLHKRKDSFLSFSDRLNNLVLALEEGSKGLERQLHQGDLRPTDAQRTKDLLKLLQEYGTLPLPSVKGIHWRLNRLEKAGLFQHDIKMIERGLEQSKLVVIQGSSWVLQVFSTYVIGALYRKRRDFKDARMNGEDKRFFPPFIVVTDEAHNFAPKAHDSPAKSILKEIAQEGRKYGVFLVLATQRPTLLDETITAQLNSKLIFRTVRGTDIQTLREETDLTPEEGKRLPYLRSGDAFVSSALFGRTVFIRIRCAHTKSPHIENPFAELRQVNKEHDEQILEHVRPLLPLFETDFIEAIGKLSRECGLSWDIHRLREELEHYVDKGSLNKIVTPFATRYELPVADGVTTKN